MGLRSKQVSKTSTEGLDHHHHHWIGGTNSNNNNLVKQSLIMKRNNNNNNNNQQNAAQSEPLKCPRCESANTKFCYYNNYNKSQPRHFCRACKRHWTKGGTLRNVPVGGARKSNKRPKKPKHDHLDPHNDNDNKSVSDILYQAMMAPESFPGPAGLPPPPPPPPAGSGSGSGSGPGPFHHQAAAETTTNGTMITPWQQLVMSSNNYGSLDYCGWSFEDIDSLVSADHIALPWEGSLSLDILKP